MIKRIRGQKLSYSILLTCIGFVFVIVLLPSEKAEAQTYNAIWITGLNASPNPMLSGIDSTTITIDTLEYAQWFWLSPSTMVRPTVILWIAGRPFIANMTSEWLGDIGFWGWWFYWWFNQVGTWTHQVVWDGRDLQGNLVPPGSYLATVDVYAGAASTFGSTVINVEVPRKMVLSLDPAEIQPEGRIWVSVTVLDRNNNRVPNYSITLQAFAPQYQGEPCDNCGGHSHDTNRPIGDFLSPEGNPVGPTAQGTTGPDGEPFKIKYKASKFGGIETIKAWGTQEPNVNDEERLTVRVPGFLELGEGDGYVLIGQTNIHSSNHHGTEITLFSLLDIVSACYESGKGTLRINDISLPYGGGFDNGGHWEADIIDQYPDDPKRCNDIGHCSHRFGRNVDVDDVTAEGRSVDADWLSDSIRKKGGRFLNEGNHFHLTF